MGINPSIGGIPVKGTGSQIRTGSQNLAIGHRAGLNSTIGVDKVTIHVYSNDTKVFIEFNNSGDVHTLCNQYDWVREHYDKKIAYKNSKKTEFRIPYTYSVVKDKGRKFWEDLTNNGWSLENK
jgi:hypothetical protein